MKVLAALSLLGLASAANPFERVQSERNAKSAYIGKLMRGAKPTSNNQLHRHLDQAAAAADDDYKVNISKYSVKFEKCQFVKAYDDDLAQSESSTTVLAIQRFVIFRLCPDTSCSSCNYNYGEYMIDLDTYLQSTVEYYQEQQKAMCYACEACASSSSSSSNAAATDDAAAAAAAATDDAAAAQNNNAAAATDDAAAAQNNNAAAATDDAAAAQNNAAAATDDAAAAQNNAAAATDDAAAAQNNAAATDDAAAAAANGGRARQLGQEQQYTGTLDCSTCYAECQKIYNMEANGYLDATNFLQCSMIYDPADDSKSSLYAGPMCASSGAKIKIGVFTDENCLYVDTTKEVDDYLVNQDALQMKLSHALLKQTYTDTCISCSENLAQDTDDKANADAKDADTVLGLCETLYDDAAKCEKTHGFDNGYAGYSGYENQLANEQVVCQYMQSIKSGTYDDTGEIIVSGAASTLAGGGVSTTGGQKFALVFFVLGTVGLSIYAAMLHSKLIKGPKSDLSFPGTMA
jgi:hypothetical protein